MRKQYILTLSELTNLAAKAVFEQLVKEGRNDIQNVHVQFVRRETGDLEAVVTLR